MRRKWLSILLCVCMALTLLPVSALAAEYPDGWPSDALTLNEGDTVTMDDGVTYTYKRDISSSGLQTTNSDYKLDGSSEIYKAGHGYVLLTWPSAIGSSIALTLHDAVLTAGISIFGKVNVTLEGDNSITASGNGLESSNSQPNLTIGGSGSLTVNAGSSALQATYQGYAEDTLTIQDSAHLTLTGSTGICSGTVTIKGSSVVDVTAADSAIRNLTLHCVNVVTDTAKVTAKGEKPFFKLFGTFTVDSGASLNGIRQENSSYTVYGTVTVPENKTLDLSSATSLSFQDGASIVNNGTIKLPSGYTLNDIEAMSLSGNGALQIGGQAVAVVGGVLYPCGGNVGESGLALATPPTKATVYTAGSGYILWNPTTAMVTLHSANINTTGENALALPYGSDTTIAVEGNNSLQSSNYAIIKTSGNISIQGNGTLNAQSSTNGHADILCSDVLTITGDVSVSALNIYSTGSVITNTTGTITAPKITALETFTHVKGTMTCFR